MKQEKGTVKKGNNPPLTPPLTRRGIICEALTPRGNISYIKELKSLSRENRKNPTEAELKLWNNVLKRRKTGFLFLRQKPINRFILDFYCSELNLAVEIDGNSHDKKKGCDKTRDEFLKQIGIKTIRFSNDEILYHLDRVKEKLKVSLVKGRNGEAERD